MAKPKKIFFQRWLIFSISGLVLIGAGLSMAIDAGFQRYDGVALWSWIAYGTAALVVFNSGICLFGQGVIYRIKYLKKK